MHCRLLRFTIQLGCLLCLLSSNLACAQNAKENRANAAQPATTSQAAAAVPAKATEIPDEPKTIDPATLVPEKLARPVTVDFTDKSLKDIVSWIQTEQKIEVLLDQKALADESILVSEQVSDRLQNYPLYLLLNRLSVLGLAWYMEEGNLHITTAKVAARHLTTAPYNVGDLFDAKYEPDALISTIRIATSGPWAGNEGEAGSGGGIVLLGDVLFVRQTGPMHREVAGLLAALRKHGRQTFTLDPPQHAILRQKLDQNVTVNFKEVPLSSAVQQLSQQAGIDIRLDMAAVRTTGVRDRTPITLSLAEQKLNTVLQAMLTDLNLTWVLKDGLLLITSQADANIFRKTAVYNVSDLCRDSGESIALTQAIRSQTRGPWGAGSGDQGTISFARPDVMVIRQTERGMTEVSQLLNNYRTALRNSKPRQKEGKDPKEVITQYYKLPTAIATELPALLREVVSPESWKSDKQPQAIGTIRPITSKPSVVNADGYEVTGPSDEEGKEGSHLRALYVQNSVLIIRQTREIHQQIAELISKIENGDSVQAEGGMGGMGGMGAGGFGGGLFSLPDRSEPAARNH